MGNVAEWGGGGKVAGEGKWEVWTSAFQCLKVYDYFLTFVTCKLCLYISLFFKRL